MFRRPDCRLEGVCLPLPASVSAASGGVCPRGRPLWPEQGQGRGLAPAARAHQNLPIETARVSLLSAGVTTPGFALPGRGVTAYHVACPAQQSEMFGISVATPYVWGAGPLGVGRDQDFFLPRPVCWVARQMPRTKKGCGERNSEKRYLT